ncbi:hypothetical protein H257_07469 [Aphanomyces astaci]|uniref:Uncharacterized protein n=1 Tax=Aphanomyces astaci TaxID=112090 RepID=W4GKN0_APHAT|nr:hypothetical protein H257_07469 [Aphanomyces astaci]ETV79468.1 hypothetical protein H257_07469 [Aphanomyces astaci]|eukprot:XP_009831309.1 hypothetical protein H257_07469 [Aphanomyces astaci]
MLDRGSDAATGTDVVDVSADGSFDIQNQQRRGMPTWEALKAEGSSYFQKKDYENALAKYASALVDAPLDQHHVLHGNRATCLFQLKKFRDALVEIHKALALVPTWDKGLIRKQCILQALHKAQGPKQQPLGAVYTDKASVIPDTSESKESQLVWRRLMRGLESANQDCLDGVFAKLTNETDFRKVMYPGMTADDIRNHHMPRTLKQLLEDPWYEQEMIDLMPKIQAKANSVLDNVKRKGATVGDVMDAATEAILRPQVLREAFGREVLTMLQRVATKKHAMLAQDASRIADPDAACALWDQLHEATLTSLLGADSAPRFFGVQDDFLGADFVPLVRSDVLRMHKQGQLVRGDGCHVRFLDISTDSNKSFADNFPALADLVEKLHALPHEINHKRRRRHDHHPTAIQLCAESTCATTLVALQAGESQPMRLDCGVDAQHDNGYRITCIYCISGMPNPGLNDHEYKNSESGGGGIQLHTTSNHHATLAAVPDRIVVLQSQHVLHGITPVPDPSSPMYFVLFRIHGSLE